MCAKVSSRSSPIPVWSQVRVALVLTRCPSAPEHLTDDETPQPARSVWSGLVCFNQIFLHLQVGYWHNGVCKALAALVDTVRTLLLQG